MTIRQRKKIIALAAGLVGLGAAAVLAAGLTLPVQVEAPEPAAADAGTSAPALPDGAPSGAEAGPSKAALAELLRLCAADLRKPLQEAAPAAPGAGPAAKAGPRAARSLTVRLIGTAIEPGHSLAMFQKPDGSIELRAEGQALDDAAGGFTVTRIEDLKVTVKVGSETRELAIPPPPGVPATP